MNTIMTDAQHIKDELLEIRRTTYRHPEVGTALPVTKT
jgi:metal-dependent amidase/aminoacylase/carboxypeptidase family protein